MGNRVICHGKALLIVTFFSLVGNGSQNSPVQMGSVKAKTKSDEHKRR